MLTQNKRAVNANGDCVYHSKDGTMCAVGCLIPDEYYSATLENRCLGDRVLYEALEKSLDTTHELMFKQRTLSMLRTLQRVHDSFSVSDWKVTLKKTAEDFGLEWHHDSSPDGA
jgi:hypothetical protein